MTNRAQMREQFVAATVWADSEWQPLPQDASSRRYFRLHKADKTCLLMDAPPATENIDAYLDITAFLRGLGLRVPEIYGENRTEGFALIEDFGHGTFTKLLANSASEHDLYMLAVDVLLQLHRHVDAARLSVPTFSIDIALREVQRFTDWFVPVATGREPSSVERRDFETVWHALLLDTIATADTFMMRDYHVDNLMIVDGQLDVAHCGLLDYQDGLKGPAAYDVMSLLKDERNDVSAGVQTAALERYMKGREADIGEGFQREAFMRNMLVLGAQRHCKNLGLFARFSRRDDRHGYLKYMPHMQRMFAAELADPYLAPLSEIITQMVPNLAELRINPPK